MKENKIFIWPLVHMNEVESDWWSEVMGGTSLFNDLFDSRLDNAEDFTIRAIVHVLVNKNRQSIEWFFEGSKHIDIFVDIHELLHAETDMDRARGEDEVRRLIADFTQDCLEVKE